MEPLFVGIREFRARLAEYLLQGERPIAVTRHGATVGYFVPARAKHSDLNRAALKEAAARMDELLKQAGFKEEELDEVTRDLRTWRKKKSRKSA